MQIKEPCSDELKKIIRFFWFATGTIEIDESHYLLPMDHSDMIINYKGNMVYVNNNKRIQPEKVVFHGFRKSPVKISQNGYCETFGITFEPWGLYPFVNGDMSLYTNEIVSLSEVNDSLRLEMEEVIEDTRTEVGEQIFDELAWKVEGVFMNHLDYPDSYLTAVEVLKEFCEGKHKTIREFCSLNTIHRRKLQRYFDKYIGVSPKEYMRIVQFENSSRKLINQESIALADLVFDGQYYDQSHFTKSFKDFTNYTPIEFTKEEPALKSKMKFRK